MTALQVEYSTNFVRQFKKLNPQIRSKAIKAEVLFKKDSFSPKLKTHKLSGRLKDLWAFSIDYKHRVIFKFKDRGIVLFYTIGSHDIYKE